MFMNFRDDECVKGAQTGFEFNLSQAASRIFIGQTQPLCCFFYASPLCIVIFRNVTPLLNEDCLNAGGVVISGTVA
jgi:hypothetical protein